jgi:beta-1,4-glucuronyltransferase 1
VFLFKSSINSIKLYVTDYSSLDYPVNVGRNIAREAANSHFIFPSDIELYPNPGLIPAFLVTML